MCSTYKHRNTTEHVTYVPLFLNLITCKTLQTGQPAYLASLLRSSARHRLAVPEVYELRSPVALSAAQLQKSGTVLLLTLLTLLRRTRLLASDLI